MKIEQNEILSKYTTFKMGGLCQNLYIPESVEELTELLNKIPEPYYLISGGSNLLINDNRSFENVILLRDFDDRVEECGDGIFYAGASTRIQKLIRFANEKGYGGVEYLYSLPALVGGIVVMNAGRGNKKDSISNFVLRVKVWSDGKIIELPAEECMFGHRSSIFKNSSMVVLGAYFKFTPGNCKEFSDLCKERVEYSKEKQDGARPNFGSVFCCCNSRIMKAVRILSGKKTGAHFSSKTNNWMLNEEGSFEQAMKAIDRVKRIHRLFGQKCETEVIIWK